MGLNAPLQARVLGASKRPLLAPKQPSPSHPGSSATAAKLPSTLLILEEAKNGHPLQWQLLLHPSHLKTQRATISDISGVAPPRPQGAAGLLCREV